MFNVVEITAWSIILNASSRRPDYSTTPVSKVGSVKYSTIANDAVGLLLELPRGRTMFKFNARFLTYVIKMIRPWDMKRMIQ